MAEKVIEKEQKSLIYKKQLDAIKAYTETEPPNTEMAMLHIRLFLKLIPDNSPFDTAFREIADPIKDTYERELKILRIQEESGRYLEAADAINTGIPLLKFKYIIKIYYIISVLYDRFNLYDDNAIIDYEL